jgi:hypothetical protein
MPFSPDEAASQEQQENNTDSKTELRKKVTMFHMARLQHLLEHVSKSDSEVRQSLDESETNSKPSQ